MFTSKSIAVCVSVLTSASAALAQSPQFGNRSSPPTSQRGTSASGPDAQVCRLVGHRHRGEASTSRNARLVTGERESGLWSRFAGALVGGMGTLAPDKKPIKTVGVTALRNNTVRLCRRAMAIPRVEIAHRRTKSTR